MSARLCTPVEQSSDFSLLSAPLEEDIAQPVFSWTCPDFEIPLPCCPAFGTEASIEYLPEDAAPYIDVNLSCISNSSCPSYDFDMSIGIPSIVPETGGSAVVYRMDCIGGVNVVFASTLAFTSNTLTQSAWVFDSYQGCCECSSSCSCSCSCSCGSSCSCFSSCDSSCSCYCYSSCSSSSSSSSSSISTSPCCDDEIPEFIYATFHNVSGCEAIEGLEIVLQASSSVDWNLFGVSGTPPCNFITHARFVCATGHFDIAFGADNIGGGTPLTFSCNPLHATYQFALTFVAEESCCSGVVTMTLTE